MERQQELQLMPGPKKKDEDEDLMPAENSGGEFHSRDSLQLSIGLYHEPQKQHEGKTGAKQEHQGNMDGSQMEKELSLGHMRLWLGSSGTGSNEGAMVAYEKEEEEEGEEDEATMVGESENGVAELVREEAREQLRMATVEKAYAEHARELAKRQMELAEAEFASAKRIREQAQAELNRAQALKEEATRSIDATCMEITCQACRQQFQDHLSWPHDQNRNNPTTKTTRFIYSPPLIIDQTHEEDTCLSLQLMPEPLEGQHDLLLDSTSHMPSTSKQQKN